MPSPSQQLGTSSQLMPYRHSPTSLVSSPPAWLAPDVHPRRFAVMPFPERPPPIPEPMPYQIPWIPPITYQPSQVNTNLMASLRQYLTSLDSHRLQRLDSRYLQNLDSHHLHHRHYPRLNTAVTPVFSPTRQPPSSRSACSPLHTSIFQW